MRRPGAGSSRRVLYRGFGAHSAPPLIDLATDGTFARASAATWETSAGVVQSWASGARRVVANGMVFEGARTNELPYSHDLSNAVWTTTNGTLTSNTIVDPLGNAQGDVWTGSGVAAEFYYDALGSLAASQFSLWAKHPTNTELHTTLRNTTKTAGTDHTLTTSWQRFSVPHVDATATCFPIVLPAHTGGAADNTIATTNAAHVAMHQVELGDFPTSYIETNGSTATRVADDLSIAAGDMPAAFETTGFSLDFYPTASSAELISGGAGQWIAESVGQANRIQFQGSGTCRLLVRGTAYVTGVLTWDAGDKFTVRLDHAAGTWDVLINDVSAYSSSSIRTDGFATGLEWQFGQRGAAGGSPFYGVIRNPVAL